MKKFTFRKIMLILALGFSCLLQAQVDNEIQLDALGGGSEGTGVSSDETVITISAGGTVTLPGLASDDWAAIGTTGTVTLAGALDKTFKIYLRAAELINITDNEDFGDITTLGGIDRASAGDLGIRQGANFGITYREGITFGFDASNLDTSVTIQITGISLSAFAAVGEQVTFVNRMDTSKRLVITATGTANGFKDVSDLELYVRGGVNLQDIVSVFASEESLTNFRIDAIKFKIVESSTLPSIWVGRTTDYGDAQNWLNNVTPNSLSNVTIQNYNNEPVIFGTRNYQVNDLKIAKGTDLEIRGGGTLIVNGTSSGTVQYRRDLGNSAVATEAWYLVSSPVAGATFNDEFVTNNDIAISAGGNRGIATYNPSSNTWSYLAGGGTINSNPGIGYSFKITPDAVTTSPEAADGQVFFTGTINTDNAGVTTSGLSTGFNLLGNPYTSYVNSATFLADNANLDQTQIWLWNQATGNYNVKVAGDAFKLAPTQGFFVKVNTGTTVNFAESNQASGSDTFQKESKTEVNLLMNDGVNNRFAKIYYLSTATKGFDSGWEGEIFGGIPNSLDVFTQLVSDNNGKNYQLQSLPISEMESMIVPVGVKAAAGKEITFTAQATNLPNDVKVFLEDKVANTITRLDEANATYKVTLSESLDGIGRFYLHTKASGVLSTDDALLESISIYAPNKTTLKIAGITQGKATVKLFNILGKELMATSFTSSGVQEIVLPKLATGMYLVQLETAAGKLNKKIVLE